jgi:uncharacterized protein
VWRTVPTILFVIWLFGTGTMGPARADGLRRATDAYSRGDYIRAVKRLSPLATRGNARAQALLGFLYENGFGYRRPTTLLLICTRERLCRATPSDKAGSV